jgi:hypothetical protein
MTDFAPRFLSFLRTDWSTMRRKCPSNFSVFTCSVRSTVWPSRTRGMWRVPSHLPASSFASSQLSYSYVASPSLCNRDF